MKDFNEKGATTVEAAITLPLFVLMVFGMIQMCLALYTYFAVLYTANTVSRWAVVGHVTPGLTRAESVDAKAKEIIETFALVGSSQLTMNYCVGAASPCVGKDLGGPGDYITVVITAESPRVLFTNKVSAKALMKNENF